MANPKATMSDVWSEDGNAMKVVPVTIIKNTASVAVGPGLENKLKRFYKDVGLEEEAKETGIIDASGSLTGFKGQSPKLPKMIQMVPVTKSGTNEKVYFIKSVDANQQMFPKVIHATQGTSGVLQDASTSARYIALPAQQVVQMATSPQTRQTPTVLTSDHLWDTEIRKFPESCLGDISDSSGKRTRKSEKGGKGLRHFSMKVCEKVQKKVTTTYNEVADELVTEFTEGSNLGSHEIINSYEQKNIRRRVYDALNVLMAMNIISKEKKEIRWIGLPTNSAQECQLLESEISSRRERTCQKRQQLQELILQQIAFKNMVNRNRENEARCGPPAPNSAIQLPFIIVNTSKKTVIDCSISNDKYEYLFNFDNTFEIHDDIEVLKRMGMAFNLEKGQCTPADLTRALKIVPESLKPYVVELAKSSPLPGTSGIRPPSALPSNLVGGDMKRSISPLALPLSHHDSDAEVAMATSGLSRASSTASYTGASRTTTETTPSEGFSDTDSDRSSPVDIL